MKKFLAKKWLLAFIFFSGTYAVDCPAQLLEPEPAARSAAEQALEAVIRKPSLKTREFINPRLALTAERYLKVLDGEVIHIGKAQLDPVESKLLVEELRRRYPAISIKERLERVNNIQRIDELSKLHSNENVKHDSTAQNERDDLKGRELKRDFARFVVRRRSALNDLHSKKASDFVAADGFGSSRIPLISPRDLKYHEQGPIALKTQSGTSELYSSEKIVELPSRPKKSNSNDLSSSVPKLELPTAAFDEHQMPFLGTVTGLNDSARQQFLSADRIGLTKSSVDKLELETSLAENEVIGFSGHGFGNLYNRDLGIYLSGQSQPRKPSEKHWNLNRLELVSLLMNDEFMVYVSENLPRMEDLKEVPTRKVDSFELMGLSKLFKGEEVVVESTTNRIRMLGALRASKSCLECHSVKEGELLGALSYELIRQVRIEEK